MAEPRSPGTCPHCGAALMFAGQSICHRCARAIADPTQAFRPSGVGEKPGAPAGGAAAESAGWKPQSGAVPWKPEGLGLGSPPGWPPAPSAQRPPRSGFGPSAPASARGSAPAPAAPPSAPGSPSFPESAWSGQTSSLGWQGKSRSASTVRPRSASPDYGALFAGLVVAGVIVFVVVGAIVSLGAPSFDTSVRWAKEPTETSPNVVVVTPEYTAEPTVASLEPTSEATVETSASETEVAGPTRVSATFPATNPLRAVGGLAEARADHTATLLADGRVAVTGGISSGWDRDALNSVEIYDPKTRTFSSGGRLMAPRYGHTATLLQDGRVLVTGGRGREGEYVDRAEIYDPRTGKSEWVDGMLYGRYHASAALLSDGKVVVIGGRAGQGLVELPEVFDPATGWFENGELIYGANDPAPIVFRDGQIVIVGGTNERQPAEVLAVYDTSDLTFKTQAVSITTGRRARSEAASCLLADGRILVVGGKTLDGVDGTIEVIDTHNYSSVLDSRPRAQLIQPRIGHSLTALRDGSALVVGGRDDAGDSVATVERWLPGSNAAIPIGTMAEGRSDHTATLLRDGSVLVVGGRSSGDVFLATAGIYAPS